MIASLKGELIHKSPDKVVVDVNGVGYEVFLSSASLQKMPTVGEEVFLHIHTSVREDSLTLFGFADMEEKEMFLLLINVSGVGPKLALTILSGIRPDALSRAISTRDIGRLTTVSGVGKKTAERLCLDLRDKVGFMLTVDEHEAGEMIADAGDHTTTADVISALVNLGYPSVRAHQALAVIRKRMAPEKFSALRVEELLRETLRSLA
jgi:Holliday junction DNA helicase RuvA